MSNRQEPQQMVKTASTQSDSQEFSPQRPTNGKEFVLFLPPQKIENDLHNGNCIKVLLDEKTIGGGTLSQGFHRIP